LLWLQPGVSSVDGGSLFTLNGVCNSSVSTSEWIACVGDYVLPVQESSLVNHQTDHSQTLGAIATVVSAFVVFVVGGGMVLVSWVAAQETAQASVQAEVVVPVPSIEEPVVEVVAEPTVVPAKPAERSHTKRVVRTKKPVAAATVSAIQVEPVPVTVAPTPVAAPVNPDGRGTVIIMGDATRVRLIGGRGTFGAGSLPSGSYTIQATFEGQDPRMAGTIEIADGERARIVCIASLRRCERR